MIISLSGNDLKMIGAAITWALYSPFYRSVRPAFLDAERERLQAIFDLICQIRRQATTDIEAELESKQLVVQGWPPVARDNEVRDILRCLESFGKEIGHSPVEVLALTGLPVARLHSLLRAAEQVTKPAPP